jgi:membrane protein YdbS with pleckstrin-like domain
MRCPQCGLEVVEQAAYCHHCGRRLDDQQQAAAGERTAVPAAAEDQADSPAGILHAAAALREIQAEEPEQELWQGGYSSRAMIGAWLSCGLITVAVLAGGIIFHANKNWWLALLGLVALVWFYEFLVLCNRRMNVHYLLTTQRFLHETGVLRRVTDRIEILDIDDIAFEQTVLERLVGVGSICIHSTDRTHPEVWLRGVGDVKRVAGIMDDARRVERRRRGLHFEKI